MVVSLPRLRVAGGLDHCAQRAARLFRKAPPPSIEANCPRRRGPSHHGCPLPSLRRCRSRWAGSRASFFELNHADAAGGDDEQVHLADVTAVRGEGEVRPGTPRGAVRQFLPDGIEATPLMVELRLGDQPSRMCIPHLLDRVSPWLQPVDLPCRARRRQKGPGESLTSESGTEAPQRSRACARGRSGERLCGVNAPRSAPNWEPASEPLEATTSRSPSCAELGGAVHAAIVGGEHEKDREAL